jgi:hypothetical protein
MEFQPERLGSVEVDRETKLGGLHDWEVACFLVNDNGTIRGG